MSEKGKIVVKALVTGGSASGGPPIGPAVGPTGINIKDVVDEINNQTMIFKGLTVPVRIECNPETKQFEIFIETPSTASLLLKEVGA
ncbi:MAG: 50S ribosomal protein L11, partial [Promethearchaeota archaeon]